MPTNRARLPLGVVFLAGAILTAGGCSSGPVHAPVDAGKAREALRTALESWKRGDGVNALQAGSPPIYVIDTEWQAGAKLVEYQVAGDGEEKDAHLFCPVRLTIREQGGKVVKREVTYVISTAPNLTVSRKVF